MKTQLEYRAEKGENKPQYAEWRWAVAYLFYLPALLFIFLGTLMFRIANFLLCDTHHFEVDIKPKE